MFAMEEYEGGEERGPRTEPWRTLIFKRWLKAEGSVNKTENQEGVSCQKEKEKKYPLKKKWLVGRKVFSDFPKLSLLLVFVRTVSMVQRLLEPDGSRGRSAWEVKSVGVFWKLDGEEKGEVLGIEVLNINVYRKNYFISLKKWATRIPGD